MTTLRALYSPPPNFRNTTLLVHTSSISPLSLPQLRLRVPKPPRHGPVWPSPPLPPRPTSAPLRSPPSLPPPPSPTPSSPLPPLPLRQYLHRVPHPPYTL